MKWDENLASFIHWNCRYFWMCGFSNYFSFCFISIALNPLTKTLLAIFFFGWEAERDNTDFIQCFGVLIFATHSFLFARGKTFFFLRNYFQKMKWIVCVNGTLFVCLFFCGWKWNGIFAQNAFCLIFVNGIVAQCTVYTRYTASALAVDNGNNWIPMIGEQQRNIHLWKQNRLRDWRKWKQFLKNNSILLITKMFTLKCRLFLSEMRWMWRLREIWIEMKDLGKFFFLNIQCFKFFYCSEKVTNLTKNDYWYDILVFDREWWSVVSVDFLSISCMLLELSRLVLELDKLVLDGLVLDKLVLGKLELGSLVLQRTKNWISFDKII